MFGNLLHLWIISSLTFPSLIVNTLPYRSKNCFNANCDKFRIVLSANGSYVIERITAPPVRPSPSSQLENNNNHQIPPGNEVNFDDSSYHHNKNYHSMTTTTSTTATAATTTTTATNANNTTVAPIIANTISRVKRQDRGSSLQQEIPPPCAGNLTYCERSKDYNTDEVDAMIEQNLLRYNELFGRDEIKEKDISIVNRLGEKFDDELLCDAHEQVVYPQYAQTADNQWKKVVNSKKFVQGIRVEVCDFYESNEQSAPCRYSGNFPNGKRAKCIQKFAYREVLTIQDDKPVKHAIKLPSCCQCVVERT